jgi:hypothetical protein
LSWRGGGGEGEGVGTRTRVRGGGDAGEGVMLRGASVVSKEGVAGAGAVRARHATASEMARGWPLLVP